MTDTIDQNTDELAPLPSITADRDDWVERKSSASGFRKPVESAPGPASQKLTQHKSAIRVIVLQVSIVIALIGGIGYLYDQLQKTHQSLQAASARLDLLEARLASTDTTMTKSDVLLGAKIKTMDGLIDTNKAEIRKLWGAAEKDTRALQLQNNELQQQKNLLHGVTEQAKQTAAQVSADSALLKNVDNTVREAVQRMEIAQETINELSADAKNIKDKQARFETDASKRIVTLEDTAKSTDVFRRNTLDELRKLREELSRQQIQSGAGVKSVP